MRWEISQYYATLWVAQQLGETGVYSKSPERAYISHDTVPHELQPYMFASNNDTAALTIIPVILMSQVISIYRNDCC